MTKFHPKLSIWPMMLGLVLLVGCAPKSPTEALRELTAEEHFSAARQCQETQEDVPLAIWHYQQFLAEGGEGTPMESVTKMELEQCLKRLLGNAVQDDGGTRKDLEEQLRLLKQRNSELESWISRLNTENLSLRQALLKAQEAGK